MPPKNPRAYFTELLIASINSRHTNDDGLAHTQAEGRIAFKHNSCHSKLMKCTVAEARTTLSGVWADSVGDGVGTVRIPYVEPVPDSGYSIPKPNSVKE